MAPAQKRRLLTAEVLSIGTELTVGDTRDTNAGELARGLTTLGVRVARLTALPDDLDVVTEAFKGGIARADLVVSTGGLGPTPDDLTREAIAAAGGEAPAVDPDLESWLRELWSRRGMPFPELNLKQAWLIPSARALPNPNGTAPGWFVVRPDGRVMVALPGPPREMRPMWADHALPLLRERGLGTEVAARTYRLTGIGESQVAERLGETLLRATNPIVATYARVEAVDVRISAIAEFPRTADQLVDEAATTVLDLLAEHVWATGETTWSEAIGARLEELSWTLAAVEIGTGGSFGALLADAAWFRFGEIISPEALAARSHGVPSPPNAPNPPNPLRRAPNPPGGAPESTDGDDDGDDLLRFARRARELGGSEAGVAIRARSRTGDTAVSIAVSTPTKEHTVRRVVFLTGPLGRSRSALAAASVVLETLNSVMPEP
jgi:competence/damage-inducible protein CinA-like protein